MAGASIAEVSALVRDGRIISSLAGQVPSNGLGVYEREADGAVLVKYTYNGDANGDGRVNADDYFRIDSGFIAQPANPLYA